MRDATLADVGAENLTLGPMTASARGMSTLQGSLRRRALSEALAGSCERVTKRSVTVTNTFSRSMGRSITSTTPPSRGIVVVFP